MDAVNPYRKHAMIRSPRTVSLALFAAAMMAPTALARPAPTPEVRSIPVDFGDLNLSNAAGLNTLMSRLNRAAIHACGERPIATDEFQRVQFGICFDAAVGNAVADVGNPDLTALWKARNDIASQLANR
jgi:UrcA family protein